MSRYIDADAFYQDICDSIEQMTKIGVSIDAEYLWAKLHDALSNAPSIDIVRCGECMHNGSYDTDCPFGWRNGEWNMPKPCDFCSYGERSSK